jgi:hypothetical protein
MIWFINIVVDKKNYYLAIKFCWYATFPNGYMMERYKKMHLSNPSVSPSNIVDFCFTLYSEEEEMKCNVPKSKGYISIKRV